MTHTMLRFLVVFGIGVGLVWALGIGPGGSWFGEHPAKGRDEAPPASGNRPPATIPSPEDGIQVRGLAIPVREELEDEPGVQVLKYWLRLGESVGGIEKHMRARNVQIEIHNKKAGDQDKIKANVHGAAALILFKTTPDPRSNFSDAEIEHMTLSEGVVVEYLDEETGKAVTTLRSEVLELSDESFHAPGPAVIVQEGLYFEGEDLTYDKATGIFRFERNVTARVSRFSLPGAAADPDPSGDGSDSGDEPVPVEKVIRCAGPCTFRPAEEPLDDAVSDPVARAPDRDRDQDLTEVLGGGTLTFEDNVVATQGESILQNCAKLILHVDKEADKEDPADPDLAGSEPEPGTDVEDGAAPPSDDVAKIDAKIDAKTDSKTDEGKLGISRMEAYGSPGQRASLTDPRGELHGEVILLEPTDAGQEIVLRGSPEIKNVVAGTPTPSTDEVGDPSAATRISGGAKDEIRVRPIQADEPETAASASEDPVEPAEPIERMALELRNRDAWLAAESSDPSKSFRLAGDKVDLLFRKVPAPVDSDPTPDEATPEEATPDEATPDEQSPPKEDASDSFELERLFAEGKASVAFAMGSFRGDRIVGSPSEPGADVSSFEIVVTPNPVVHLDLPRDPEKEGSKDLAVDIQTDAGSLTYAPPADDTSPTAVNMKGKTHVAFHEDGVRVTTLDAEESVDVEFQVGGASGIKSLVAAGSVVFESERQGVRGSGDSLVLIPIGAGEFKMDLRGSPAEVTQAVDDAEPRVIRARRIIYDPETGKLHAEDDVDGVIATLPGFGPEVADAEASSSNSNNSPSDTDTEPAKSGALRARVLDVTPIKAADGTDDLLVEAVGLVSFRDPQQGVDATGHRLVYRESAADATLYGTEDTPAKVVRVEEKDPAASDADETPSTVSIKGPMILINKATQRLSCPRDGVVVLVRQDKVSKTKNRVAANASGPIVYQNDQLVLRDQVLIRFEADGKETRALWSDVATVVFAAKDVGAREGGGGGADSANASGNLGFEYLLAEGRVHIEQNEPRPLVGEGDTLEWRQIEGRDVMILKGIHPRAWVEGLMTNRHLRYVADTFRFFQGTDQFEVENGEFTFIGDER